MLDDMVVGSVDVEGSSAPPPMIWTSVVGKLGDCLLGIRLVLNVVLVSVRDMYGGGFAATDYKCLRQDRVCMFLKREVLVYSQTALRAMIWSLWLYIGEIDCKLLFKTSHLAWHIWGKMNRQRGRAR